MAGSGCPQLAARSALRGLGPLGLPPAAALLSSLSLRPFGPVGRKMGLADKLAAHWELELSLTAFN